MAEGFDDQQKLTEIEMAHKLTMEMKIEAAKYKKLASLALDDEIQTIKNVLRGRWIYLFFRIKSAQQWLSMKYKDLDRRKKYNEKDSFDYFTHQIEELLDLKIEITDISSFGYDESAYFIKFKLKEEHFDREFELTIPDTEKLNPNNLNELHEGKLSLHFNTNTSFWDFICDSYDKEELKNKFKEWLNQFR